MNNQSQIDTVDITMFINFHSISTKLQYNGNDMLSSWTGSPSEENTCKITWNMVHHVSLQMCAQLVFHHLYQVTNNIFKIQLHFQLGATFVSKESCNSSQDLTV